MQDTHLPLTSQKKDTKKNQKTKTKNKHLSIKVQVIIKTLLETTSTGCHAQTFPRAQETSRWTEHKAAQMGPLSWHIQV